MDLLCIKIGGSIAIFLFDSYLAGRNCIWRKKPWQLFHRPWKCFFLHIWCLFTSHVSSKYYNMRGRSPPHWKRKGGMEKSLGSDPWGCWARALSSILPFWTSGTLHAVSTFQKDWGNVPVASRNSCHYGNRLASVAYAPHSAWWRFSGLRKNDHGPLTRTLQQNWETLGTLPFLHYLTQSPLALYRYALSFPFCSNDPFKFKCYNNNVLLVT